MLNTESEIKVFARDFFCFTRSCIVAFLGLVNALDHLVGATFDSLKEANLMDDTFFILLSDVSLF